MDYGVALHAQKIQKECQSFVVSLQLQKTFGRNPKESMLFLSLRCLHENVCPTSEVKSKHILAMKNTTLHLTQSVLVGTVPAISLNENLELLLRFTTL